MGQNGRLVAEYAGSSKLLKRISLIISGMNFGDMLDIAHRYRIAGNAAVEVVAGYWCGAGWRICHGAACYP